MLNHYDLLDERCQLNVVVSGSTPAAGNGWVVKTDYTGEYRLHSFHNGKPAYRHSGPANSAGTKYPGTTGTFYLFLVRGRSEKKRADSLAVRRGFLDYFFGQSFYLSYILFDILNNFCSDN